MRPFLLLFSIHLCARCSCVLFTEYPLFTYYFFTLLFLQYVNELFARITPTSRFRMAIPLLRVGTNNAVISQLSISQYANF